VRRLFFENVDKLWPHLGFDNHERVEQRKATLVECCCTMRMRENCHRCLSRFIFELRWIYMLSIVIPIRTISNPSRRINIFTIQKADDFSATAFFSIVCPIWSTLARTSPFRMQLASRFIQVSRCRARSVQVSHASWLSCSGCVHYEVFPEDGVVQCLTFTFQVRTFCCVIFKRRIVL
jgi:hypothetical protein